MVKVTDSHGRVHECLQSHLDNLSTKCRQSELVSIKMVAQDPSANVQLLSSCTAELKEMCGITNAKNALR